MDEYAELFELMNDPDSVARCPECSWTETEALYMHERTGEVTYECLRCYAEFRM